MLNAETDTPPYSNGLPADGLAPSTVRLPAVPSGLVDDSVSAWAEPLIIDSYLPGQPENFPAFLETRV